MEGRRIGIFFGLSILAHLLVLILLFVLSVLNVFAWTPDTPPDKPLIVKVIPPPPPPQPPENQPAPFVDSSQSIPTEAPDPNALFQSDQNTAAMSRKMGVGDTSAPSIDGEEPGLNLRDSPYTPENQTQASSPSPARQEQVAEAQAIEKQEASPPDTPELPKRLAGNVRTRQDNLPNEEELLEQQRKKVQAMEAQMARRANAPPMEFQAQKRRSNLPGGATLGPDDSFGANETDLGRYKRKLYQAIGSRWYAYVENAGSNVNIGEVTITFRVSSEGKFSNIEVISGSDSSPLCAVSKRSIFEAENLIGPFPESMQQQFGDYYDEKITFTVSY
jgi:outer membrane biosynthesis protein TonB